MTTETSPKPFAAKLPWIFIWFRALAGLTPWLCALLDWPMYIAAAMIPLALLSDIFDGIIARAHGVATQLLRRADGWADLIFVLSYTGYVIINRQDVLGPLMVWIYAVGIYKGVSTIHDFVRYGRGAAFHFWTAKLWAIPFYGLLFELVMGRDTLWMFWPTIFMGFIAITEEFIAVRLIPIWMQDQPNIFAALTAYRQQRASS